MGCVGKCAFSNNYRTMQWHLITNFTDLTFNRDDIHSMVDLQNIFHWVQNNTLSYFLFFNSPTSSPIKGTTLKIAS